MALPVEFDSVPGVVLADFAQVLEAIFAHLGDGHIPRQGKPFLGILAEEPFGVVFAQFGQFDVVQGLEVAWLSAVEVIVVHAQRGVHVQAELMAAVDNGLLGVFAPIQHAADVFSVRVAGGVLVAALVEIADEFKRVAWPAGGVFAYAPK